MAQLIEREAGLGMFETFHFAGHWDTDGTQMIAAMRAAASHYAPVSAAAAIRVRRLPAGPS